MIIRPIIFANQINQFGRIDSLRPRRARGATDVRVGCKWHLAPGERQLPLRADRRTSEQQLRRNQQENQTNCSAIGSANRTSSPAKRFHSLPLRSLSSRVLIALMAHLDEVREERCGRSRLCPLDGSTQTNSAATVEMINWIGATETACHSTISRFRFSIASQ